MISETEFTLSSRQGRPLSGMIERHAYRRLEPAILHLDPSCFQRLGPTNTCALFADDVLVAQLAMVLC